MEDLDPFTVLAVIIVLKYKDIYNSKYYYTTEEICHLAKLRQLYIF